MIDLNTALSDVKEQDNISVIELYDISLRTGILYICNTDRDITFEGNKYVAIPIEREDISLSVDDIDNEMKITMSDATTDQLRYIIAGFEFRGCTVRVRQILYPESLADNSIFREAFYGYIDNPAYENGEFSCTLRSRIPKVTVPRRTFQSMCNCKFGDDICQADIAAEVDAVKSVVNDNQIAVFEVKEDEYWNNGIITIEGESRMIKKSVGNIISTYYPFFAEIRKGMRCALRRGCDKTMINCAKFDNLKHFTGFPSIPYENIYR